MFLLFLHFHTISFYIYVQALCPCYLECLFYSLTLFLPYSYSCFIPCFYFSTSSLLQKSKKVYLYPYLPSSGLKAPQTLSFTSLSPFAFCSYASAPSPRLLPFSLRTFTYHAPFIPPSHTSGISPSNTAVLFSSGFASPKLD